MNNYIPVVEMPWMQKVRLPFPHSESVNIEERIRESFATLAQTGSITAGKRIAVAVGSREIDRIAEVTKSVCDILKHYNCIPVIVPAMGSHGNALAENQKQILNHYGVTESFCGAPIHSSMDTVQIGTFENAPIYIDAFAAQCDGVVAINRVKPHTDFFGPIESGICKMLAVGLGKHRGALTVHQFGPQNFDRCIPGFAQEIIQHLPLVIGVALLEDAYHHLAELRVFSGSNILSQEKAALEQARAYMAKLPFPQIDLLIIDQVGKNISGSSMDPNITGRNYFPWKKSGPSVNKIVALRLHEKAEGDGIGVGNADIITRTLRDSLNFEKMYTTGVTAKSLNGCKIPFTAACDRDALSIGLHTVIGVEPHRQKIVHIKNTLEIFDIEISKPLLDLYPDLVVPQGECFRWTFSEDGTFKNFL